MQIDFTTIKKISWVFHRTTGIEWQELFGEASLAYTEALSCFDPKKSSQNTWTYIFMRQRLINFCKKQNGRHIQSLPNNIALPQIKKAVSIELLNKEAQDIYQMIINSPKEYEELTAGAAKTKIKEQLRQIGWSWRQIIKGINELKQITNGRKEHLFYKYNKKEKVNG